MPSLRSPTIPPPRPNVDRITPTEAWEFLVNSLRTVEDKLGKPLIIAKRVSQEHPKKPGDFSEYLELDVGGSTTKVTMNFIVDMGLYLEVIDCHRSERPRKVINECLTSRESYQSTLGSCLLRAICNQLAV
jgi:hypothetical protein